jgi:hypothetical protein
LSAVGGREMISISIVVSLWMLTLAFLCFKMSRLYRKISVMSRLISQMIRAGVSHEALTLVTEYQEKLKT